MPRKSKKLEVVTTVSEPIKVESTPVVIQQVERKEFVYEKLSASMAKTWLSCKRKFHMNYIEGIKSPPNESFTLGTSVHYALEQANKDLVDNPRELNPLEIGKFIQDFRDKMAELNLQSTALFAVGEELVRTELQKSSSKEKIIGIEKEFDLKTPEGVRIYGFMDKLVEVDPTTVKIIDYKTSVTPMSYEEAKTDLQLSMYDLAVALIYPQYEHRILELRYLRDEQCVRSNRTEIEQNSFRKQLLAIDKAIRNYVNNAKQLPNGDLNEFCNWCPYKTACPQFVQNANTLLPAAPSVLTISDDNFLKTYQKVQAIAKAADEWKDMLKTWLAERKEAEPELPVLDEDGNEVTLMSSTNREYDVIGIGKLIGLEDLLGKSTKGTPLVKIQNKALETYLKAIDDKKLQKKVEKYVTVKFKSPQIKINKRK